MHSWSSKKIRKISNSQNQTKEQVESSRVTEALDVMRTFTDTKTWGFGVLQIHRRKAWAWEVFT